MLIGFNEIQRRAIKFATEWEDASDERAEAQLFWRDLLEVFGVNVRAVGRFEERVRNVRGTYSRIDLFWPSVLLAKHKSRGEDLGRAHAQASQYIIDLQSQNRADEIPRYLLVSDFEHVVVHDLDTDRRVDIKVSELHRHVRDLEFIAGISRRPADPEDPVNIEAAERLAKLKDALEAGGYPTHELERFMVRVLFCLYAEDTGLLGEPDAFRSYIENNTKPDGADLGLHIAQWFEVLNQPADKRSGNLDEQLRALRFVNGELFAGRLPFASFNRDMRDRLLECCRFDWSKISPAVFGSLFQSIMTDKERRQIGAHYTTERDILKVIRSLFLDELYERFEKIKNSKADLKKFHAELGRIKVLDPACGCGNFLVIAYSVLRRLEIEVLRVLHPRSSREGGLFNVPSEMLIDVDQMHGIEIEEWPAQIAKVALWLVDHQMNLELSQAFGEAVVRLPLTHSAKIANANALRMDWNDLLPADECSYVLGNPPFVGAKYMNAQQREDVKRVWESTSGSGLLDYVSCWYAKAAQYTKGHATPCAFVSTNSITQGEQAGVLWNRLAKDGVQIIFGHRTFPWASDARGMAHVHVVIVGFQVGGAAEKKRIYDYDQKGAPAGVAEAQSISPYLTEGPMRAVSNRSKPLCQSPPATTGNKPIDNGNYLFTPDERMAFLKVEPKSKPYFKRWLGGQEFLQNIERWCLDLEGIDPTTLRSLSHVKQRVDAVRKYRQASASEPTRRLAASPAQFHTSFRSSRKYLALPEVSSERRPYIPLAYLSHNVLCGNKLRLIPRATLYHFGVLQSEAHMTWVRTVTGRLKSDFQWSIKLVYNNFPWPAEITDKQRESVEAAAQAVLDARAQFPSASLADLYDPLSMPKPLRQAHTALDRAVDRCYRPQPFPDERRRFEYLFELWETLERPLAQPTKKKRGSTRKKAQA